jgi:hypothetical protein
MPIHDWTRVDSGIFHDFHQTWAVDIKNALNGGLLPKGLSALVERKSGDVEPDVLTIDHTGWMSDRRRSGAAVMERPIAKLVRKSSKDRYAELANRIVVKQEYGNTIAVIEIVSPGNKHSRLAFKQFIDKSQGFLIRGIHLLAIDLFAPSKRDPQGIHWAIWEPFEEADESFEFPKGKDRTVVSYEADRDGKSAYVEPVALGDTLPTMPLFLDSLYHIPIPLEETYQTAWRHTPEYFRHIVETGEGPPPIEE